MRDFILVKEDDNVVYLHYNYNRVVNRSFINICKLGATDKHIRIYYDEQMYLAIIVKPDSKTIRFCERTVKNAELSLLADKLISSTVHQTDQESLVRVFDDCIRYIVELSALYDEALKYYEDSVESFRLYPNCKSSMR